MLASWSSLFELSFGLVVVWLLARGIYNKCFHPLRHVPGPFWAGVTDFFKLHIAFGRHLPTYNLELHIRYGPVVRVAPGLISISDPTLIPIVYQRQTNKSDFYSPGVLGETTPTVQIQDYRVHAAKRRLLAPVLRFDNIRACEGKIDERILELQAKLSQNIAENPKRLDFSMWVRWFLMDAILHSLFGRPGGFVKEGRDIDNVMKGLRKEMSLFALALGAFPWLVNPFLSIPFIKRRLVPRSGDQWGSARMMNLRDQLMKEHNESSEDEQDKEKGAVDLVEVLHKRQEWHPEAVTDDFIETECLMLMIAALDSTSGLMSPLMHNVVKNPEVYRRLMDEIDQAQKEGRISSPVASYDEISSLPWFTACTQETLRLDPSVPITLPRLAPAGGFNLHGIYIPEGSEVGANAFVINRDRSVFGADADIFRPERWLGDDGRAKKMDDALFTFGYGSRGCLGSRYAKMEIQKLAIHLFRNFTFEHELNNEPWALHADRGFAVYKKQWLRLKDRQPSVA